MSGADVIAIVRLWVAHRENASSTTAFPKDREFAISRDAGAEGSP
jgi:hypothetical protein